MDYAKEPNRITWVLKREKLSKLWLEKEMGKQKKDQREATQRKRPQAKEGRQIYRYMRILFDIKGVLT